MMRSTRFWMVLFLGMLAASVGLSSAFGVPGSNNDPLRAEIGNGGMVFAVLGLLVVAVVGVRRQVRGRRRAVKGDGLVRQRRAWVMPVSALGVAAAFALETHNWNSLPEALTSGLLVVGLIGLALSVLMRPSR
jgi:peptidoglycan/LPS O-acetylase OafA/YrhL